jgi:deazaflavin-dependent oxidoreductase (nitroreductase family)
LDDYQPLAGEQFCYLTTSGRKSGGRHTVEMWFAVRPGGRALYMLSGGRERSDWVKNIRHNPRVEVRISGRTFSGQGRVVQDPEEDLLARKLVVAKYYGRDKLHSSGWEVESLPVAVDLDANAEG